MKKKQNDLKAISRFKSYFMKTPWNYVCTILQDESKFSTQMQFKKEVNVFLNKMTRRLGWVWCLFFESTTAGYVCNALLYIPQGKMIGSLITAEGITENSCLSDIFGYNQFKPINTDSFDYEKIRSLLAKYCIRAKFKCEVPSDE